MDQFWIGFKNAIDITWEWLNKPLPVVCVSIVTVFIFVITIINRTSFGRRAIVKLTNLADSSSRKIDDIKVLTDEFTAKTNDRVDNFVSDVNSKIAIMQGQLDYFETAIFDSLGQLPNVKVKKAIEDFKSQYDIKKQEIADIIGSNYANALSEREEKIKLLEDRINELTDVVKELKQYDNNEETL